MAGTIAAAGEYRIAARIERLPLSTWHLRIGLVIGTGFFFDAFDAMALAYALAGAGRAVASLRPARSAPRSRSDSSASSLARYFSAGSPSGSGGCRAPSTRSSSSPLLSLACAFAWNLPSMMAIRFIQGLGLGGEIPILATYVNEFANAKRRGRFAHHLSIDLLHRPAGHGLPWRLDRAEIRLAVDVHHRRRAGPPRAAAAPAPARDPALARQSRPPRRGRPRADAASRRSISRDGARPLPPIPRRRAGGARAPRRASPTSSAASI